MQIAQSQISEKSKWRQAVISKAINHYHRLRGSPSRVNGDWLCQWEMAIPPPHRIHTL